MISNISNSNYIPSYGENNSITEKKQINKINNLEQDPQQYNSTDKLFFKDLSPELQKNFNNITLGMGISEFDKGAIGFIFQATAKLQQNIENGLPVNTNSEIDYSKFNNKQYMEQFLNNMISSEQGGTMNETIETFLLNYKSSINEEYQRLDLKT